MSADDVIAKARVVYEQIQDATLAASVLGPMADWIESGRPPPAETLRSAGLTTEGAENAGDLRLARQAFIRKFGFSIPCAEAVAALKPLSPLVEIGAGAGYWTALLRAAGAEMTATDIQVEGAIGYRFELARYCQVEPFDAVAAVRAHPDCNVFCSWPTQNEAWAAGAAEAIRPGRRFVLIGDERGGITATDTLYDLLDRNFTLEAAVVLPQFPKVRDRLTIHRRNG